MPITMMTTSQPKALTRHRVAFITGEIYVLRLVTLGASLVSNVFLARLLGATGKGMVTATLFWPSLLGSLLIGGFCTGVIAETGKVPGRFRPLARGLSWFILAATFAGAGGLQLVAVFRGSILRDPALLWCASSLLLTNLVVNLFGSLYTGLGRLAFINRVTTAGTVLFAGAMVALSLGHLASVGHTLFMVAAIQSGVALFFAFHSVRQTGTLTEEPVVWRPLVTFSLKAHGTHLGNLLFSNAVMILLTLLASPATLGIYSIALICTDLATALPVTWAGLLLPVISRLPRDEAAQRMAQATRLANFAGVILIGAMAVAATFLIPIVFGPSFAGAVPIVWMLTLSAWAFSTTSLITCFYHGINRMAPPIAGAWLGVLLAAGLGTALIGPMGGLGAALAVSVSRVGVMVFLLVSFRRDTGLGAWRLLQVTRQDLTDGWMIFRQLWSRPGAVAAGDPPVLSGGLS
ncbi:MAG: hypothetical protein WCS01_03185 [bacterium]